MVAQVEITPLRLTNIGAEQYTRLNCGLSYSGEDAKIIPSVIPPHLMLAGLFSCELDTFMGALSGRISISKGDAVRQLLVLKLRLEEWRFRGATKVLIHETSREIEQILLDPATTRLTHLEKMLSALTHDRILNINGWSIRLGGAYESSDLACIDKVWLFNGANSRRACVRDARDVKGIAAIVGVPYESCRIDT